MTKNDEISASEEASMTMNGEASDHLAGMQSMHGSTDAIPPLKRGPGRPPGSLNRPKAAPMTPLQRETLKAELGATYRDAILARTLAETRTRGVTALIKDRLGKDALAEIQAEIIRDHEARMDVLTSDEDAAQTREAKAA